MKELMKKLESEKGISLITLSVAVTILIIITGTLIYSARDTVEIKNLKNMYNDIELLDDKVEIYYTKFGGIPGKLVYDNEDFWNGKDKIANTSDDVEKNSSDDGNYYIIDLALLEGVTSLNYGRDYDYIKDFTEDDYEEYTNKTTDTDIYIINQVSHQIYYVRGIESDGKFYYTNELKTQKEIDMKITVIDSIEDLVRFEQKVNGTYKENTDDEFKEPESFTGKHVVLTRDLDFEDNNSYDGSAVIIEEKSYILGDTTNNLKTYLCEETGWTPIGDFSKDTNPKFSGTFDGNVYSISNIYINNSDRYQGLFGCNNGTIENLTLSGEITVSNDYVGGISGYNQLNGKIYNCTNKAKIISTKIEANAVIGGISGRNGGNIEKCINIGEIEGKVNCIGGIAGGNISATITKCINHGLIKGNKGNNNANGIGGIVGYNASNGEINKSINNGIIEGDIINMGGIIGNNDNAKCFNCYNTGSVSGVKNVGGILGNHYNSEVTNCYNIGSISGSVNLGGTIGNYSSNLNCTNNYYLTGTASYGIGSTSSDENAEPRISQVMKSTEFVKQLGRENWKIVSGKNNGYPILEWE